MGANSSDLKRNSTVSCFSDLSTNQNAKYFRRHSLVDYKHEKPLPPESAPVLSDIGLDSITLSWKSSPVERGVPPAFNYVVEKLTDKTRRWETLTSSCQSTSYTCTDVSSSRTYSFRVRAENIYGVGKPSRPSQPVCPEHAVKMIGCSKRDRRYSEGTIRSSSFMVRDHENDTNVLYSTYSRQRRCMSLQINGANGPLISTNDRNSKIKRKTVKQRGCIPSTLRNCDAEDENSESNRRMHSFDDEPSDFESDNISSNGVESHDRLIDEHRSDNCLDLNALNVLKDIDLAIEESSSTVLNTDSSNAAFLSSFSCTDHNPYRDSNPYSDQLKQIKNKHGSMHSCTNSSLSDITYDLSSSNGYASCEFSDSATITNSIEDSLNLVDRVVPHDDCPSAISWMENMWDSVEKMVNQSNAGKRGHSSTHRTASNTLTCDWESLSDTSLERTFDTRNTTISSESLNNKLDEESEIDSQYDFD